LSANLLLRQSETSLLLTPIGLPEQLSDVLYASPPSPLALFKAIIKVFTYRQNKMKILLYSNCTRKLAAMCSSVVIATAILISLSPTF